MGVWVTAIVFAGVQSFAGFPYSRYKWWHTWISQRSYTSLFVIYLVVAGVLGGTVGWTLAYLSKVHPTGNWLLDGILYGAVGSVALRATFGSSVRKTPNPRKTAATAAEHSYAMNQTISLLGGWVRWIEDALDKQAEGGIADWVYASAKDETRLRQISSKVKAHIRNRSDMNANQRKGPFEIIEQGRDNLAIPKHRGDAISQLVLYCADYMTSNQMDKRLAEEGEAAQAAP